MMKVAGYWLVVSCLVIAGCGSRKSSLLLERQARGPMVEEQAVAQRALWSLDPATQTKAQGGIDVTVTYTTQQYLSEFFRNKEIFGQYAGLNPYFPEQVVFYVKLANNSNKKIHIEPEQFVVIDDKGNQYHTLSPDYNTALAEAKAPVGTLTRGVLEEARPGYFGIGVPVGKIIGKPQQRFALLKMSSLQAGYLHPGVVYDGLIAFWSPHQATQKVKLLLTNIKTDFNANEWPQQMLEFAFEFTASQQQR
jgi:hypothetical protein